MANSFLCYIRTVSQYDFKPVYLTRISMKQPDLTILIQKNDVADLQAWKQYIGQNALFQK